MGTVLLRLPNGIRENHRTSQLIWKSPESQPPRGLA